MQFKKPTSLGDAFAGNFSTNEGWLSDILDAEECYAVANGEGTVKRVRFIQGNGSYVSIPYSWLPAYIFTGSELIIRSHGVCIAIQGKGLSLIENYLHLEQLLYLKSSITGIDTNDSDVFISSIEIQGKNLSKNIQEDEL